MSRYLLVDGNNATARSNFAMRQLATSEGRKSGAVHGFFQSLNYNKKLLSVQMSNIIVLWDGGRSKKRLELYPDYKGNRKVAATPDELEDAQSYQSQVSSIVNSVKQLGVRSICVAGVEADDLISITADLLTNYGEENDEIYILSGDKDFHQLVAEKVKIIDPIKGLLTERNILDTWEIEKISQIPFKKALTGDASDGIVGVPKVGPARAKLVLNHIPDFDTFLNKSFTGDPGEKTKKWIDLVYEHTEVIKRNMLLMKLPSCWEESFYGAEERDSMLEQSTTPKKDLISFAKFLRSWELEKLLDTIDRW